MKCSVKVAMFIQRIIKVGKKWLHILSGVSFSEWFSGKFFEASLNETPHKQNFFPFTGSFQVLRIFGEKFGLVLELFFVILLLIYS